MADLQPTKVGSPPPATNYYRAWVATNFTIMAMTLVP